MNTDQHDTGGGWLFAYFREVHGGTVLEESLHYALSGDGLRFTPLRGNRPVWHAEVNGAPVSLRDPFIARGLDARYHLLATHATPAQRQPDGRYRRLDSGLPPHSAPTDLLHAAATDLVTWSEVSLIPVLSGVPAARNLWAPEFISDLEAGDHLVIWSTSTGRRCGGRKPSGAREHPTS